jgi:hypothetical protein
MAGGLVTWSWQGAVTALHHADPTCARHGVLRGQVDTSVAA